MKKLLIALTIIVLLGLAGWAYWYFMMGPAPISLAPQTPDKGPSFQPLNPNGPTGQTTTGGTTLTIGGTATSTQAPAGRPSTLRLLSQAPVGGFAASTTASTTNVRWVDRGRGNVYETSSDSLNISTLSNTVVPKIFAAVWNRDLTAFVGSLFEDGNLVPTTVYSGLVKQTGASSAAYELRGRDITGDVIGYAASPDGSRLFTLMNENGNGAGYVSAFDGSKPTRIFSVPLTQLSVSWPSDSVIVIETKSSASYSGFLYFVNPRTGTWTKVLGPVAGLSAVVSHDARYVLYSSANRGGGISTGIYNVAKGTTTDAVIRTIADKCAWGKAVTTNVYCGVPSEQVSGSLPDDWYTGTIATTDKVWRVDALTGEVSLLDSLTSSTNGSIDVYRPDTDPKDRYLYFMDKGDLSLWSLDLSRSAR
jgi:hypothetical protein